MDQAEGLRRMRSAHSPVRVIAVSSGKGGVGKTNVVVNLALAMARKGKKTMIFDADLGLGNIDVLLGLAPKFNLGHVVKGDKTLEEVMVTGPADLSVIPAASGIQAMAELSLDDQAMLIRSFSNLSVDPDILLIDTAAGISSSVLTFSLAAQELIVVISNEPTSITDAYALIKVLSKDYGLRRFHILANMVQHEREGRMLFDKVAQVADRYLDVLLTYFGAVPMDAKLRRSVQHQRAVVEAFPDSPSAKVFTTLSDKMEKWPMPKGPRGGLEFFVERLIEGSRNLAETGAL